MELRRFPPGPIIDDLRFPADLVDDDLRKTCRGNQPPPASFSENLRARCEVSARSSIFAPGTRSYRVFCRAAFTAIEIEPFPFDGRCHRWIELRLVTTAPIDLRRRESGSMYGGGDGASPPATAAEAAHPMTTRAAGTAASPTVLGCVCPDQQTRAHAPLRDVTVSPETEYGARRFSNVTTERNWDYTRIKLEWELLPVIFIMTRLTSLSVMAHLATSPM